MDGITGPLTAINNTADTCTDTLTLKLYDRIELCGMYGTVTSICNLDISSYPVTVMFDDGLKMVLTEDGRQYKQQTTSPIKVIGTILPKVKKWHWAYRTSRAGWKVTEDKFSLSEAQALLSVYVYERIDCTEQEMES